MWAVKHLWEWSPQKTEEGYDDDTLKSVTFDPKTHVCHTLAKLMAENFCGQQIVLDKKVVVMDVILTSPDRSSSVKT